MNSFSIGNSFNFISSTKCKDKNNFLKIGKILNCIWRTGSVRKTINICDWKFSAF